MRRRLELLAEQVGPTRSLNLNSYLKQVHEIVHETGPSVFTHEAYSLLAAEYFSAARQGILDCDDELPIFCSQLSVSPALVLSDPPDCISVPDGHHLRQLTVDLIVEASSSREDLELLII